MEVRIAKHIFVIWGLIFSTQAVNNFLPSIQWTPDNPIFNNLKDQTRKVKVDDELMIWCPKYYTQEIKTTYQLQRSKLYFALYKVETKEDYDNCDARNGKRLLYCKDPSGTSTEDIEERQIVFMKEPISNYMDPYPAGNTYYFIGTSGGVEEDLDKKVGGKCQSHNMKFAIYVCRENENCSVDVLDGGWSLWKVNEATGLCERNCTNPAPQNGGSPCRGPDKMECSKIISGQKSNPTTAKESTTETTTAKQTTKKTTVTSRQQKVNTTTVTDERIENPTASTSILVTTVTSKSDIPLSESNKNALDEKRNESDDVTLSMKSAVLTFVGLFILGCIVGIVQVLVILHVRSKRSGKQPEHQTPVNHV